MFAIIQTGGKQYKVAVGDVVKVEKLELEVGSKIDFDVLLTSDNGTVVAGNPVVMTFTHCPYKVVTGSNCNDCKSNKTIFYTDERNNHLHIRKYKLHYCYFELLHDNLPRNLINADVIDLRTI